MAFGTFRSCGGCTGVNDCAVGSVTGIVDVQEGTRWLELFKRLKLRIDSYKEAWPYAISGSEGARDQGTRKY